MSANTAKNRSPLFVAADEAWYWEEGRAPDTVEGFVLDVYHLHPQDIDGFTHREENALYHIFDEDGYRTLPAGAPKLAL